MTMFNSVSPTLKAAAIGVTALGLAVSTSTSAMAGAKAFSSLQISDFAAYFAVDIGGGNFIRGGQINASQLGFLNAIDTTSTSAELNGTPAGGLPSDLTLKCVGAMCGSIAEDDYNMISPQGSLGNFARADVADAGAIIAGLPQGSPATGQTVAEVQLVSTAAGQSSSQLTNSSTINFNATRDFRIWIEFDADLMMDANINPGSVIPGTGAQATANFGIELDEIGVGNVFSFNPDGILQGDEISDPFSLTSQTATALFPGVPDTKAGMGLFAAVTPLLSAGIDYSLGIQHSATAQAEKFVRQPPTRVSEPATLPIMALGLLGSIAMVRRQRVKKTA